MAAPTLQAQGNAAAVTTGDLTITLPAYAANDIVVITTVGFVPNTTTGTATQSLASPWNKNSPNVTVITSNLIDEEHACWWARATSASSLGTTVTITRPTGWDTGTDTCWGGRAYVIRGCVTTGNPFDDFASTALSTAANPVLPAITVAGGNRLALIFMTKADNTTNPTAATGYTVGTNATDTAGTDCSFQTYRQVTSANLGTVTPTGGAAPAANNGNSCYFEFAFIPDPVTATAAAPLGGVTGSASATVRHNATLSAPLGGVTGSASATVRKLAVLAAPLGAVTASASATVTKPAVTATGAAPLGAVSSSASATVTHLAVLSAPLGALSASASAEIRHFAVLTAPLGAVVAAASATVQRFAVLAAPLGATVSTASAVVKKIVSADAPLGALSASAIATIVGDVTATAQLGGVTSTASATVTHSATLAAPLGSLIGSASATVIPPTPPTPPAPAGENERNPNPYLQPRRKKQPVKKAPPAKGKAVVVETPAPKIVKAFGKPTFVGLKAKAEGKVTFSAEEDDLQVLLML